MKPNEIILNMAIFIEQRKEKLINDYKNETSIQKLIEVQAKRDELMAITEFLIKETNRIFK